MRWHGIGACGLLIFAVVLFSGTATTAKTPKLTEDDVLQHHLDSIGTAEARAGRARFRAEGDGTFGVVVGGSGDLSGSSTVLSDGQKFRLAMFFGANDYPGEDVAYDGESVEVGYTQPGRRSQLGQFLFDFDMLVSEGLLGGAISTGWTLYDLEARQPKLKYEGLKKLDGTEFHTLRYMRKKGGDAQVRMYFDKETFQHIHTVYKVTIRAGLVHRNSASVNLQDTEYTLKETFGNYRQLKDLNLPTLWMIDLNHQVGVAGSLTRWTTQFKQVFLNPEIDPANFTLGLKKSD